MNNNQETQTVEDPHPGDNFAQLRINMETSNKKALKDVISHLVDQAYAEDQSAQRKLSKPFVHRPTQPIAHHISPTVAAGRLGAMIANLPPVILKEKSKK